MTAALDACLRARQAWERQDHQTQLDFDPDAFRAETVLVGPPGDSFGLCSEGGRTERQGRDGRGSESARGWLTAAAASHAHGGCAPPPSTETNQGEA